MRFNLNYEVTADLTEAGRRVLADHVAKQRLILPPHLTPKFTGQETRITMQFHEFIRIFGAPVWGVGCDPICKMEVVLEDDSAPLDRAAELSEAMSKLSDAERLAVFDRLTDRWCQRCGRAQPKDGACACWNDE